jgi:hypothetical protein
VRGLPAPQVRMRVGAMFLQVQATLARVRDSCCRER